MMGKIRCTPTTDGPVQGSKVIGLVIATFHKVQNKTGAAQDRNDKAQIQLEIRKELDKGNNVYIDKEEIEPTRTSSPTFSAEDLMEYMKNAKKTKSFDRIVSLIEQIDIPR